MSKIAAEMLTCDECGKPSPHKSTRHAVPGFEIRSALCWKCITKRTKAAKNADKSSAAKTSKTKARKRSKT